MIRRALQIGAVHFYVSSVGVAMVLNRNKEKVQSRLGTNGGGTNRRTATASQWWQARNWIDFQGASPGSPKSGKFSGAILGYHQSDRETPALAWDGKSDFSNAQRRPSRCDKSTPPTAAKIQSNDYNNFNNPTQPTSSSPQINHPVDLNFSTTASPSISYSSVQTANITGSDFPVFTTDPQSTWPPHSTSPSLSATNDLSLSENNNPQDFVLFDSPPPNRPASLRQQRRPSSTNQSSTTRRLSSQHSPAVRNQRVSQIIQGTGHQQPSSPVNTNLFDHQFYASSAPSSTVSLNHQSRPNRPPVPLFHQSTGSVPTAKMMNAADVDLDDFTAFEGGHTAFSSPAMPTSFDFPAASGTSSMGTVSPNDLFVTDNFMSAPNSSALTALTSPSINESPDNDAYDVSPHFQSGDFGGPPAGDWFPLFPKDDNVPQQAPDFSPEQPAQDLESPPTQAPALSRRKSGNSSPTTSARHSSVSGVNSRKRDKPLPPIVVEDPHDTVAMKRARNTLAARKSRERKAQRFEDLEDRIAKLEAERDHWKRIALSHGAPQN